MEENEILGTWGALGAEGTQIGEYLAVPAEQLTALSGTYTAPLDQTFLCIAPPPSDEKKLPEYQRQMEALRGLLETCGVLPPER